MGASLRLLTRFAGADAVERLGLLEPARRLVRGGARVGFAAGERVARFASRPPRAAPERVPPAGSADLFDLTPSEEQQLVRDTMRRFADEVLRPAAEAADEACAPPAELLAQAHELGLTFLAVPEALGGGATERSSVANALVLEELARGDMGLALAIAAPLAAVHALVDWGTPEQQSRYLPPFVGDAFVPAAAAMLEPWPLFDPHRLRTGAVRAGGRWALHGDKTMVPLAQTAELFVVSAEVAGLGPRAFVVERDTAGLEIAPEPAMGLRAAGLGRLRLRGARVPADAMLGDAGRAGYDHGAAVDRARVAWSAMAVGAAQAVLDHVVPFCNEREAFGEPISHRQSVAFLVADVALELEAMRLMTWRAAARFERGLPVTREAALARIFCADHGMKIGTDGVQLLGGAGFIKDHPVERWYRHLRAIGVVEGGLSV